MRSIYWNNMIILVCYFSSASMSRKLLRQRSIKEAKAKLEHNSNSLSSPTVKKHFPLDTDDSFDRMMKAHADFTNQLLKVLQILNSNQLLWY